MCTEGAQSCKKLLDRSIGEFSDTLKSSPDERCLALINDNDAADSTHAVFRSILPEDSWKEFFIQVAGWWVGE